MLDKIKYFNVKPGKYKFLVKAKNYSSDWSEVVESDTITIRLPFYLTWWFLVIALFIFIIIIFIIFRIRVQKTYNQSLIKEISVRKKIEQDLIESKQIFQDLVQLLPEPIYETDTDGKIIYMNNTGTALFHFSLEEIINKINMNQLIAKESLEELVKHNSYIIDKLQTRKTELLGLKKDKSTFPLSLNTVPRMLNKKCIGTRGILIDLSEQKNYETKLKKYGDELKLINASKDKFFSIIAHDLRSPFNAFLGLTEIMAEELNDMTIDEIRSIADSMKTSARNLFNLLENLLQWAKMQQGVYEFNPTWMQLMPVINFNLDVYKESFKNKNITLINNIKENIEIEADAPMLNSIIRNLISNAVKFTPKGGIISIDSKSINNNTIEISIQDNGIGMSEDFKNKLFKIDEQTSRLGTEGEPSSGLGLLLCKEFIEKHGGSICIDSHEGKGSTFSFTIKKNKLEKSENRSQKIAGFH